MSSRAQRNARRAPADSYRRSALNPRLARGCALGVLGAAAALSSGAEYPPLPAPGPLPGAAEMVDVQSLAFCSAEPSGGLIPAVTQRVRGMDLGGRWHQPRTSLLSGVAPEAAGLGRSLEIVVDCTPGCDPLLFNRWVGELEIALNGCPQFRVETIRKAGWETNLAATGGFPAESPVVTDLQLRVLLRHIDPYRPMRLDAALELVESSTGAALVRLDGEWLAPRDSVPLRPTRRGWLRRNWHPPPAITEEAALEATSPQAFVRSAARQMSAALCDGLSADRCVTGSGLSIPAASHPPQ